MKYIKLFTFDCKNGILRNTFLWLAAIILPVAICIDIGYRLHVDGESIRSFADYLMAAYGGMKAYKPLPEEPFIFPVVWIVLMLSPAYATLKYPLHDIQSFGQQVLYRSKGRLIWWLSKCSWNVLSTLLYHSIVISLLALGVFTLGSHFTQDMNEVFLRSLFDVKEEIALVTPLLLSTKLIVVPIMISVALNLLQMMLSLFVKPVCSFLVILVMIISSSYLLSPYLLGNYAMILRSDTIWINGVNFHHGLLLAVLLILFAVIIGAIRFKRYDIMGKE